jgi:hypothetical protein
MKNYLYLLWLRYLRYANTIDLDAAKRAGNEDVKMWCRNRISNLDRQIDNARICA